MQKPRVSIIAALGTSRAIGKDNQLLWHIPDDLKRFKALTLGHPVIMGRKTFVSILSSLGKPLPGRTNIVISRDPAQFMNLVYENPNVVVVNSLKRALQEAHSLDRQEIFICGGSQVYTQALPFVDRLYLTLVESGKEGDVYFPEYTGEFRKVLVKETREWQRLSYQWVDLER